jgi:hypothetical protein
MVELLLAADLFLVTALKVQVERALVDAITADNVDSLLELAVTHHCSMLLQQCRSFKERKRKKSLPPTTTATPTTTNN